MKTVNQRFDEFKNQHKQNRDIFVQEQCEEVEQPGQLSNESKSELKFESIDASTKIYKSVERAPAENASPR